MDSLAPVVCFAGQQVGAYGQQLVPYPQPMAPPLFSLEELESQVCSEGAMNGPLAVPALFSLEELESQVCSREAMGIAW